MKNVLLILQEDYSLAIYSILFISFGVPLILAVFGIVFHNSKPKTSKVLYIIAGVYLLISLGICGAMMI